MNKELDYLQKYSFNWELTLGLKDDLKDKSLSVFGGSGALGNSLLLLLACFDIRPKGINLFARPASNLNDWINHCRLRNISLKIHKSNELTACVRDSILLYFAGYAQPKLFMRNPEELHKINTLDLENLANKQPQVLIYTSTTEVYSPLVKEVSERDMGAINFDHPRASYILSKRLGETILYRYWMNGLNYKSFRVALATSPYYESSDTRVLNDLIRMAQNSRNVHLAAGHSSIRQYQWGPNCVNKLLIAGLHGSKPLYNIAGGERRTLADLAIAVSKRFDCVYSGESDDSAQVLGAPSVVRINTALFDDEFSTGDIQESLEDLIEIYTSKVG